jgi:hypothetical protein
MNITVSGTYIGSKNWVCNRVSMALHIKVRTSSENILMYLRTAIENNRSWRHRMRVLGTHVLCGTSLLTRLGTGILPN